jgi:hypothetical protein
MLTMPYLEITTQIGCKVNCIQYCPQELIVAKHSKMKKLSCDNFDHFISTVPKDVTISFAGFCEPFLNQECTDMMILAHESGYRVQVYSTLVGLTLDDAKRVIDIPFEYFVLHLPDADGKATIPITDEYLKVLGLILSNVRHLSFMNMGAEFTTCDVENIARGKVGKKMSSRVTCVSLKIPNYTVLPNGDVHFCCVTRGLTEKIGSLMSETYPELISKFKENSLRLQTDPDSICHRCGNASNYYKSKLHDIKCRVFGKNPILGTI